MSPSPKLPQKFAPHPAKLDREDSRAVFEWTGRRADFAYESPLTATIEMSHAAEEASAWGPSLIAALLEMGLRKTGNPLTALKKLFTEVLSLRAENKRLRETIGAEKAARFVLPPPRIEAATFDGTEVVSRSTGVVIRIPRKE